MIGIFSRAKDITNHRFGRLIAIRPVSKIRTSVVWECLCDCGNITYVKSWNLGHGTLSCGCLSKQNLDRGRKISDLQGKKFNELLVLERVGVDTKRRTSLWKVRCGCGTEKVLRADMITSGSVKSCGCRTARVARERSTKEKHWNWRGGCYGKYTGDWTDELKEQVRNRDNRKCQFPGCNYSDLGSDIKLDVHHIDGIKEHSYSKNLISLCHKHHMKIESNNPRDWEDYFYSITGDYEYA